MNASHTNDPRVVLPSAPQAAAPFRFPVVAAIVPIVASLAIWFITGSMFALVFAALGPLAATGSYVDSRITARKNSRTESRRFAFELSTTQSAIAAHHRRETADLAERTPPAIFLVRDVHTDSSRWMREPNDVVPVHLGYGHVRSDLAIDGGGTQERLDPSIAESYQQLIESASHLQRAPIAVNGRLGIAIFGVEIVALSLARALSIQISRTLSPATTWARFRGAFSREEWASHLPHRVLRSDGGADADYGDHEFASAHWGKLGDDKPSVSISVVFSEQQVPSGHRIVISAAGDSTTVVSHPDKHQRRDFEPSFLGREQALAWALAAHDIASRDGLATHDAAVPDSVRFSELLAELGNDSVPSERSSRSLQSRPAVGAGGRTLVDLVANGPHAIVGGTTGSGKSELLISWVLAMAAESSPGDVNFLLVDFKGGSAFTHLAELPHTVGIITDLDESVASRAFASLRAELQFRERTLAQAGARDVSELDTLPRLVIVVDEFAAMMADYPQLHALFSDVAARGRSLGVHLVLCTQRPSGVVRDSLLANADLRISLRVNNAADSSAVIGSDRAAELPAQARGRAWVAHGSSSAELVQFALATRHDIVAVASRWPATYRPRRPWCEPLAASIPLGALVEFSTIRSGESAAHFAHSGAPGTVRSRGVQHGGAVSFGLTDLPEEQRQTVAEWSAVRDGNIFIIGAPGSGKSVAIATIAEASMSASSTDRSDQELAIGAADGRGEDEAAVRVLAGGREPAGFWDVLAELHGQLDRDEAPGQRRASILLTIDDLDAVIARFDDDYRIAVLDRLARVLREGPARGIAVVASAQRITPALQSLVQLMPNVMRLRLNSRQDFVLSGGMSADYNPDLPPGGALWKGARVQIALGEAFPPVPMPARVVTLRSTENLVIASSRPRITAAAIAAAGWQVRELDGAPGSERELLIADTEKPIALIGSIDEWQSRWGSLALLRTHNTVVLDGCNLSDFRQLARTRELPPPLASGSGHYWRITEDGADRVRLSI
ncbi:FtsK/SpoIIIE domain-containing protein [Salinibacterium sp. M195]|uniref:FtsK/SpoIIIE domain-containing protein n=1 Tax=Salinibacterium sp. M195 TaxID=2583374 RepID=UPI001C62C70A|nr:FtsK/SpoIIIE domain-containing protein [Salinibacterium sp. M195]QYH36533.1 cell division protein [Salinibacterium sp. M195]